MSADARRGSKYGLVVPRVQGIKVGGHGRGRHVGQFAHLRAGHYHVARASLPRRVRRPTITWRGRLIVYLLYIAGRRVEIREVWTELRNQMRKVFWVMSSLFAALLLIAATVTIAAAA